MASTLELIAEARQHHQAGRLHQAQQLYGQVLEADPTQAHVWYLLGAAWHGQGQANQAIRAFQQARERQPGHADACHHMGVVLAQQNRIEEAAACFGQALKLQPGFEQAQLNLRRTLPALEQRSHAKAAEACSDLGLALAKQGKPDAAEASLRQAILLRPDFHEAHCNLGVVLAHLGRLDEAVACARTVLALAPDYPEAHNNLGKDLLALGKANEALAHLERAVQLAPDMADARLQRATLWLQMGDFARGWPEYEWRWRIADLPPRPFTQPLWDGSPLAGRTMLLHAEQGLGDALQFIRYAPLVKERGGVVIVEVLPPLVKLAATCPGIDQVVGRGSPLPSFDVHAPLLSLPRIFGTELATIPAAVPYLSADPRLVEHWRRELASIGGFKVGIAWKGSSRNPSDRCRSVPLACYEALAQVDGVRLLSLQKGEGCEQLATIAGRFSVLDLGSRLDEASGPFMDTAAILQCLDLAIVCDSALLHLSGALAVPAWAPLALAPDWRWHFDRDDSPWYPSVRLFRQTRFGEWDDVFQRLASELRQVSPSALRDPKEGRRSGFPA